MRVSLNRIKQKFNYLDSKSAIMLRTVLKDKYNACGLIDNFKSAYNLDRQCYNPPGYNYLKMTVINELLGAHGIEYFEHKNKKYEYVNMGDSYANTVIRQADKYHLCSVGDIIEGPLFA